MEVEKEVSKSRVILQRAGKYCVTSGSANVDVARFAGYGARVKKLSFSPNQRLASHVVDQGARRVVIRSVRPAFLWGCYCLVSVVVLCCVEVV